MIDVFIPVALFAVLVVWKFRRRNVDDDVDDVELQRSHVRILPRAYDWNDDDAA